MDLKIRWGEYRTIYMDPPWEERGGGRIKRGADKHYPLMSLEEIKALPVRALADTQRGCHLYLWTTNNFLPAALSCLKEWNFSYITMITWMKDKVGLGQYYRGMTEHCIFASTVVTPSYKAIDGVRQTGVTGFYAERTEHSKKPEKMREMIEAVSYGPRVELFAREQHPGWDTFGNEVKGQICIEL